MKQTDPQFKLRVPQELFDEIKAAAAQSCRSVNAEIVSRLSGEDGGNLQVTLRDYFAAKALPKLIEVSIDDSRNGQPYEDYVSQQAYDFADAMLKARAAS